MHIIKEWGHSGDKEIRTPKWGWAPVKTTLSKYLPSDSIHARLHVIYIYIMPRVFIFRRITGHASRFLIHTPHRKHMLLISMCMYVCIHHIYIVCALLRVCVCVCGARTNAH